MHIPPSHREHAETGWPALLRHLPAESSLGPVPRYTASGQAEAGLTAFLLPCEPEEKPE